MARAARFAGLLSDTIVALASAPGEGGRAILRLSGEGSFPLVRSLVRFADEGDRAGVEAPQPYTVLRGELALPGWAAALPVLLYLMPAPRSYTREDVAEIHLIGSPPVVLAALEACRERGARLAHPGEFTRRALLAGRITLSQAEAVLKVVDAQEETDVRSALQELNGSLGSRCADLAERLFELVTQVEAGLDFSQEDITVICAEELARGIAEAQEEVEALLSRARESAVEELPTVLLFGRPNVGKSSLFNRLLGRDAALVTPVAGTTRDAVEGILQLGNFRIRLLDGAGQTNGAEEPPPPPPLPLGEGGVRVGSAESGAAFAVAHSTQRAAAQGLEARASARTRQLLDKADLTLHLIDGSQPLDDEDRPLATLTAGGPHLWVLSKADLPRGVGAEASAEATGGEPVYHVSAKSGRGLEELREALRSALLGGPAPAAGAREPGAGFLLNARQREVLARSASALAEAHTALTGGLGEEFVASDLWEALDALGEVTGQRTSDDLLDAIFSRFCIGK